MKNFILGLFVGAILFIPATIFAEDGLEKIEAYLRPNLPITLDGEKVTLESSPIMYDGSTYVKLRDAASLTGTSVNWNENTQTVEISSTGEVLEMPTSEQPTVDRKAELEKKIEKAKTENKIKSIDRKIEYKQNEIDAFEKDDLVRFDSNKDDFVKRYTQEKFDEVRKEKLDHINKLKTELAELEKEKADLEGQLIQ